MNDKICVIGLGYIGLPTALLLAQKFNVIGVDIDEDKIKKLQSGILPFEEEGLRDLFEKVKDNFTARSTIVEADAFLIAVPTPLDESLRIADLSYVRSAAEMISTVLQKGNLVILESTVSPNASEHVIYPILSQSGISLGEYSYVHCPERAIPGKTLHEMVNNDRIIGAQNDQSFALAKLYYSSFVRGTLYQTNVATAEFVKLMENTFRDINIALANEFAQIAREMNIDVWEAIALANRHPRVDILSPGPGVGGHCIAIDPWFLTENSTKTRLISLARSVNDNMPNYVLSRIRTILKDIEKPTITLFGVAYKANVDDWRATPALRLIRLAQNEGIAVKLFDPHVKKFPFPIDSLEESLDGSDCIILITDHDYFNSIVPDSLKMRTYNLFDTRNTIDKEQWISSGFNVSTL